MNTCPPPNYLTPLGTPSITLPSPLIPVYWTLIILIFVLAAYIHIGYTHLSRYISTSKSVLSLIFLDTLSFHTLTLSTLLLVIATLLTRPWHSLSPTFIGPMLAFIAASLSCTRMQPYQRRMLTLWLRAASMLITNDLHLNLVAVSKAVTTAKLPPTPQEPTVVTLVRADTRRGILQAARNKGSARPLVTAVKTWWHQGSTTNLPRTLTRVATRPYWRVVTRQPTHRTTLQALQTAGVQMLRAENEEEGEMRMVRVVSSFDTAARRVVHSGFGNVWMAVMGHAGVRGGGEGWWYVGAEIVEALKAAMGVRNLSAEGRFDDAEVLWRWVDALGYGWRREFQTEGVAKALAKRVRVDEGRAVEAAGLVAGGMDVSGFSMEERGVAREANAVAALGLAVTACVAELQFRLDVVCRRFVEILGGGDVWMVEGDGPMIMGMEVGEWPEDELARMLVRWVGEAAVAMGRYGGPEVAGG